MAEYFYDGMPNVNERLNQLYSAFAAGPYNSLPLTGGALTGPVGSTSSIAATSFSGGLGVGTALVGTWLRLGRLTGAIGAAGRMVVGGVAGYAAGAATAGATTIHFRRENDGLIRGFFYCESSGALGVVDIVVDDQDYIYVGLDTFHSGDVQVFGQFSFTPAYTNVGVVAPVGSHFLRRYAMVLGSAEAFSADIVNGVGTMRTPLLKCATLDSQPYHVIAARTTIQGDDILSLPNCAGFRIGSGAYGNLSQNTSLLLTSNTVTGRSLNAGGTINASGADYAEYMVKSVSCCAITPGQIVGIDTDGRLTDKWDRTIAFMVKSTNPCMVGGDSWAQSLGARPVAPTRAQTSVEQELITPAVPADEASGVEAVAAVYRTIVTAPGDTDVEWAAKQAAHAAALATFEAALEQLRQTVDRIAFAGQVPVNVQGATPGQYIVPVQDGEGIIGMAVDEADMTLTQYMRAIGKVIAIEDDGRARIIVKVA
jgi:hypothetical protein